MRIISESEFKNILEEHKKWLDGDGGERANLRYVDLQDANLQDADLQGVDLQGADLRNANLRNANLRYVDLQDANLQSADLRSANLDFSCMPLYCGDLKAKYDEKQIIQQLYHVLSHVKFSEHSTDELKEKLLTTELIELANRFHRVEECEKLD